MDTTLVEGFGLYGLSHACKVLIMNGEPRPPKRAVKPLCRGKRVKATSRPFIAGPRSCSVCTSLAEEAE